MAGKTYVANWLLQGVGKKPLNAGESIVLSEEEAQPFVECGVLSEKPEPKKKQAQQE